MLSKGIPEKPRKVLSSEFGFYKQYCCMCADNVMTVRDYGKIVSLSCEHSPEQFAEVPPPEMTEEEWFAILNEGEKA